MSGLPATSHADTKTIDSKTGRPTLTLRPQAQAQVPTPTVIPMHSQKKTTSAVPPTALVTNTQQKKVPRRSSKPIINWFQRKLAGSGKSKRTENVPLRVADLGMGRNSSTSGRHMNRITSSPLPGQAHYLKQQTRPDAISVARRKTRSISLHGEEELRDLTQYPEDDTISLDRSSLNRDSIWSPASALEADDDASVRPIAPSVPPSPSPSRSSSSYLSDPRTFRSMAASTKPTTLLSIDLNGNGMAHIAQAPTPPQQINRFAPHVRQSSSLSNAALLSSGASITFSAIPSSRPNSLRNPGSVGSITLNTQLAGAQNYSQVAAVQAPLHTNHHPRNNPRPSSPPMDNASVLTLASSAFGIMPNRLATQNYTPSAIGDSASHYGGSIMFPDAESVSHYVPGDDDRLEERDVDASVRALRPRSSRRGSWESEASGWSARVNQTGASSLARERSLWTSSIRTGQLSTDLGETETYDTANDPNQDDNVSTFNEIGDSNSPVGILPPVEEVNVVVEPLAQPSLPKEAEETKEPILSPKSEVKGVFEEKHLLPRASLDTIAQVTVTPCVVEEQAKDKSTDEAKPDML